MEKIVIFGTGSAARKAMEGIDYKDFKIVGVIDNNKNMHEQLFNDVIVCGPEQLRNIEFDKIMICSTAFRIIKEQLIKDYHINGNMIANKLYFLKNKLVDYYKDQKNNNAEISEILTFLEENDLEVFNYKFRDKYYDFDVDVQRDSKAEMYYVIHNGKRMYFKRSFNNPASVIEYYRFISREQDKNSPHSYFTDDMKVKKGDVVVDAGVAEGNFALDVIEEVSKIYLIETDEEWIDALKYTFEPYQDKVVFVNKFLSNKNDQHFTTLDNVIGEDAVNYIKMDIEGEEYNALNGAVQILQRDTQIRLNICSYHNNDDEYKIIEYLKKFNITVSTSKGYMFFVDDATYSNSAPRFVRGLVLCVNTY